MYRYRDDFTDMIGGAVLVASGSGVSLAAISQYPLGTVVRIGPGMFPAIPGYVLAGLDLLGILGLAMWFIESPEVIARRAKNAARL